MPGSASIWWKIEEAGSELGIRFMIFAYRWGGRLVFRFLLFFVICFFFLTRRSSRDASMKYLRQLRHQGLLDQRGSLWRLSFLHFWQFGDSLIDKISVWLDTIDAEGVEIINHELVDDIISTNSGAMVLVAHLGNFEVCQCLSQRRPTLKLTVLQHTQHAQKFNAVLERINHSNQIEFMQVTDLDVGSAISLSKKISQGHFLAIAGDRISVSHPGTVKSVNFLGTTANLAIGPFSLALALGCPVLALHCVKKQGKYHISFEQLKAAGPVPRRHREAALRNLMAAYLRSLEKKIAEVPLQWFNFFDFFETAQVNQTSIASPQTETQSKDSL